MDIDYVVISSDDNKMYKDFYHVVSKQWNDLGFKVFYINITDNDTEIIENEFGLIKNIKAVENINTGFQSQVARLYASVLLKNKNLLMSDIDMMVLNGCYFSDNAKSINEDKLLLYSGQPYSDRPYYPMCYILGKGKLLKGMLEIEDNYTDFIIKLSKFSNLDWTSDEKYIYSMLQKNNRLNNCVVLRDRDFNRRIDRSNWNYDNDKLKNGYYIDSHLLRPYSDYSEKINKITLEYNKKE